MSLSKQLYLGLIFVLTLVFVSTLWINVVNTSHYINKQLASHAQDTATSLGLSIKPFISNPDDLPMVDGMINAIFDSGYYQQVILKNNTGKIILEKTNPREMDAVPLWFMEFFPLSPPIGKTEVHAGWVKPKTLEIISHPGFAYAKLWESAKNSTWMILGLFLVAGAMVFVVLKTITDPIKRAAKQADEICQGNFVQVTDIPRPIELNLFVNAMNRMSRILQKMFDELTQQTSKYQRFAYIDELTGIANRRAFNNEFESLLANKEHKGTGFLLIIRLSSLDSVNKSQGYVAGDKYVMQAVSIINEAFNKADNSHSQKAYRLAGADFAVILQDCSEQDSSQSVLTLMSKFNQTSIPSLSDEESTELSNSFAHIGMTIYSTDSQMSQVLVQADNALLEASTNKKGWSLSDETLPVQGSMVWKKELDQLLQQDKVVFASQAIKTRENELLYHELFARFSHTQEHTPIPMSQLMQVAKQHNLTREFDKLVINKALEYLSKSPRPVALNLSPTSLGQDDFCHWLINTLNTFKPLCQYLTFEISEQALIQHADKVCVFTENIKRQGCKITLEHFGASTSSFTHLMRIKPDHVKIDGSYCQRIDLSTENQLFVQSLVNIAHSLQITVIAELIETEAQQKQLADLFVDYFQGFFIDKPQIR
jgi:diguanylate cyclase (GGDEF)-like protein